MSVFRLVRPLYMASQSPRRQEFLRRMGLDFMQLSPLNGVAEPRPESGEAPDAYVLRAACAKAEACQFPPISAWQRQNLSTASSFSDASDAGVILAADTIVALGNEILGKPRDSAEALDMLRRLAGREHAVLTAVCLRDSGKGGGLFSFVDRASVHFAAWSDDVLRAYAESDDCLDKAGAYGIQGLGVFLSDRINGACDTVAGLPVCCTMKLLLERGVIAPAG